MRPSLSPGDQLRSLASPLGQTLPSAPWKLHPVSPLHSQCYSIIPTFEMRQVQRREVACPSQLASKGRSPDPEPALSPSTARPGTGDDRRKGIRQGRPACAHVEEAKAETLLGAENWKTPPPFLVGSLSVELLPCPSESGWNKTTSYPAFSGADGQEAMDWHQGATVFTFFTCTPRGPGGGLLESQGPLQRLRPEMMVLKEPQA